MNRGQIIFGTLLYVAVLLIISHLSTGSLNPFEIFDEKSLFLKIIAVVLMGLIVLSVIAVLFTGVIGDKRCPSDNCEFKPLIKFAQIYGSPVYCRYCGRWFHAKCLAAHDGSQGEGCKHPGCPSAVHQDAGDYLRNLMER